MNEFIFVKFEFKVILYFYIHNNIQARNFLDEKLNK